MFELHIQNTDVTAGAVPITWCIDKETLKTLKEVNDPLVVISIIPISDNDIDHGSLRTEQRYIVPLREAMTYVSFKKPGPNKIFGFIDTNLTLAAARRHYLERYGRRFDKNIVNYDGDDFAAYMKDNVESDLLSTAVDVNVPDLAFAKEPSEFERAWVCWLIPDKGNDQCAFRRRKMFAYTLQIIIMLAKLISISLFTLVATLIGSRGTSLKYLFHPLTYDVSTSFDALFSGGTVFVREVDQPNDPQSRLKDIWWGIRSFWTLPLMPPIAVVLTLITHFHRWSIVGLVFVGFAILFSILIVILSGALGKLLDAWWDKFINSSVPWSEDDAQDLICDNTTKKKIAPKRRTVRLRYLALKSKVCKPFAG